VNVRDFKAKLTEKYLYINSEGLKILSLANLFIKNIPAKGQDDFFISNDERLFFNGNEIWDMKNGKLILRYNFPDDKRKISTQNYYTNSRFDYFSLIYGYQALIPTSVEGSGVEDLTLVLFNKKGEVIFKKNYGETSDFFDIRSTITEDGRYLYIYYDRMIEKYDILNKKNIYSLPVIDDQRHLPEVLATISIFGDYPYYNKIYIEDFYDYFVGKKVAYSKLKKIIDDSVLKFYNERKRTSKNSNDKIEIFDDFDEVEKKNALGEQSNLNKKIRIYDSNIGWTRINSTIFDIHNNVIATFIFNNFNNWIIQTPDKYFFAPNKVSKSLKYRSEGKIYTFDQFDLFFNRPDIVLERIGVTSKAIIDKYKAAYLKRVEKMGFNIEDMENDKEQPIIEVVRETVPFLTSNAILNLLYSATGLNNKLDRVNLYVNGNPVYGMKGINLREKSINSIEDELKVQLSSGINKIELSVHNQKGVESKRETFEVFYQAPPKKPSLYVVTIGVSDYQDKDKVLKYAAKDASDMAKLFNTSKNAYSKVETITLKNQEVTKDSILKIKQKLATSGVDDKVVLLISGHGILDKQRKDWYFATQDMDFDHPSLKGISYNDLEGILDGIPARNKLFLLDACHSGELDTGELNTKLRPNEKEINTVPNKEERVLDKGNGGDATVSQSAFESMKIYFTDIRRFSGSNVISAARGYQSAYEGSKNNAYNNGYFTYAFIDGIKSKKADKNKDGVVRISELSEYIHAKVVAISGNKQVPTNRQENLENDFVIWIY